MVYNGDMKIKTLFIICAAGYLAYVGYYNYYPQKTTIVPETAIIAPEQPVIAPEPPKKVDAPEVVDAPLARQDPPPKRLAPEGVYYLIISKSIETDSGITSYRVGTQVSKVSENEVRTTDGVNLPAKPEETSNDLDLVSFVSSIRNKQTDSTPEIPIVEEKITEVKPAPKTAAPTPKRSNPLDQKAYDKVDFGKKGVNGQRRAFAN